MIVEHVAQKLALSVPFLMKLARTASHRYKEYTIAKRNGGLRTIHHPARELKLVQGWLLHNVLVALPVHPAAMAYRSGSNILRNAQMHAGNNYLLRVDFKDFFPSLRGTDVRRVLRANRQRLLEGNPTNEDITFIKKIVCRKNPETKVEFLTIGAPTSPHLSNAIMFEFDELWTKKTKALKVTYTRYADDLYFSTNRSNVLQKILDQLRESLKQKGSPKLHINDQKTIFSSRKRRRLVAGLVLTSDRKVSIGRDKKRTLKSLVWRLKRGELQRDQVRSLQGWIAYLRSVEPPFVESLERKYEVDFGSSALWEA